ncbi:hypothetical protein BDA99DRAFT_82220 [Phascolomyces articulosus]|uniref:Uncharacterized protein n=1 Tax=Phascolomyces articulosus TaxID=60185 RepID=A0AAD5K907_9FUNG|nr:hypothetical protein BDA99DRAFT_82220 [Phascolomyces articulosus]
MILNNDDILYTHILESSRETVNEGEELIMTSRALRKWERKVTESPDKQDKEKHCPELPILENNPKAWLHNSLGEIINTSDVNCRNTLDSDQKVTLKEQPKHYNRLQGQNMDRESFHCPYKSCRFVITDSPQSMENGLQHIRRDHFFEFPVTIEHSSNVLDQGDKIFIKYLIPAKDAQCDTQYCPYQTCKYTTK